MSAKQKQILLLVAVVLLVLKFRNQILGLLVRVPVLGPFIVG